MLKLFVYGTLKRGFWNHEHYCRGFLEVEEAQVRGRLFETCGGIPVLMVPEEDILATGTADPLADLAIQEQIAASMFGPLPTPPPPASGENTSTESWRSVYGELFTFDDPEKRLPAIDYLEGFEPGGPSYYRRVLVSVRTEKATLPAWVYTGFPSQIQNLEPLDSSRWPADR